MAAKKITIDLSANSTGVTSEVGKAKSEINEYANHVKGLKSSGGIGQSLRAAAMEERRDGAKQIERLLQGGTIGIAGIVSGALSEMGKKWAEIANEMREGNMSVGEMADKLAGTLPIIGQVWTAGRSIHAAIFDIAASAAEWLGYSEETVFALQSDETALKRAQTEAKALTDYAEKRLQIEREIRGIGLTGKAKNSNEHANDIEDAHKKLEALAKDMNESPAWHGVHGKQGMLDQRARELAEEVAAKNEERIRAHNQTRGNMLDTAHEGTTDQLGQLNIASQKAKGDEHLTHLATVDVALQKQIASIKKWRTEQATAYPEIGDLIGSLAAKQINLANVQAEFAAKQPLKDALNAINAALSDSKFKTAIDKRIDDLRKMGATEEQLTRARLLLQVTADKESAKGIVESTRTPLEALAKTKRELDRMKENESIDPDTYKRSLGDAADKARRELGLDQAAKGPGGATEQRHGSNNNVGPALADPISRLVKVNTDTLIEAQKQTKLLQDRNVNVLDVIKIR